MTSSPGMRRKWLPLRVRIGNSAALAIHAIQRSLVPISCLRDRRLRVTTAYTRVTRRDIQHSKRLDQRSSFCREWIVETFEVFAERNDRQQQFGIRVRKQEVCGTAPHASRPVFVLQIDQEAGVQRYSFHASSGGRSNR